MSQPINVSDIKAMSIPERILLVEEIWDSIATDQESLPVSQAQKDELDRRIAAAEARPDQNLTWDEVKARLKGRS